MLRPYKGTLRDDPPLVARVLLVRSHPQRRGLARRVRLRPAVPRPLPLEPSARGQSAPAEPWLDHVALSGVAAARRRGSADHPRRGRDAVAHGAAARGQARLARALREGGGSQPHRLVQGPRARGRRDPRRARGGQAPGGAHRRERRRGGRGLRGTSRAPGAGVCAGYHAAHHPRPDPQLRRRLGPRGRSHRGLRQSGPRVRCGDRRRGRVDVARALPHRGQEDAGPRARGAARVDAARCDRVSHRWRHRPDRHVEGVPGAHARRLARRNAAPAIQRAGRGMRARRERVRGRGRVLCALAKPPYDCRGAAGSRPTRGSPDASSVARERRRSRGGHGRAPRRGGEGPADARGHRRLAGGRGVECKQVEFTIPERAHGRHVGELVRVVERAPVSDWVKERAVQAFQLVGDAEGRVHGVAPEKVHLHEVGAVDAVLDIVGAIEGFEQLDVEAVYAWPVAVGNGWVEAEHGRLPVPAPATAILLEGVELATGGPVEGEATTPTGAALVRVLAAGPPPGQWRMLKSGWGAGQRNPKHYPNALRILFAEQAAEAGRVALLATDVDDMSPEYVEPLRQALVAAGALDVQTWPVQMKKGRSGFRVEVVAPEECAEAVTAALFRHSTTAGIRRWVAERATLARRHVTVRLSPEVTVRVKVLEQPDAEGVRVKPEYDDVLAAARVLGRPPLEVARVAQRDAEALVAKSKE